MMGNTDIEKTAAEFHADSILPKKALLELQSVVINEKGRLEIVLNHQILEYPVEWLRSSCQCEECFNPICRSFNFMMKNIFEKEMKLKAVAKTENGVRCVFADDHTAEFSVEWLFNHRLTSEGNEERVSHLFVHHPVPWTDLKTGDVQKCIYQKVTDTSQGLANFCNALVKDGIVLITDTPDRDVAMEFANKTGMEPLWSHYGSTFRVVSNPSPINIAYTGTPIDFHVDMPYAHNIAFAQFLHCKIQAKSGGENIMTDGLAAALALKEQYPEYYKVLTTLKIQHEDVIALPGQQQFYMAGARPVINLSEDGVPRIFRLSACTHSCFFPGTAEEYETYAQALKTFYSFLNEYSIQLKTEPGETLVFDNQRVLHGRLAFPLSEKRELEGWYVDMDKVYSALRVARMRNI